MSKVKDSFDLLTTLKDASIGSQTSNQVSFARLGFARIAYSEDTKSIKITHGGIEMQSAFRAPWRGVHPATQVLGECGVRRAPHGGGSDFPLFSKDGESGVKEWTGLVGQGRESKPFEGFPVEVFLSARL